MQLVVGPVCIFAAAWAIHVAVWHCCRPRNTVRSLVGIFAIVAGLAVGAAVIVSQLTCVTDLLYAFILYTVIVLAYLISYTGLEGQSPSALIVIAAWAARERGITRADIETLVTEDVFISSRVGDLVAAGHMKQDEHGRYHLTARGRRFVALFMMPRRLMKVESRGG